MNDIYSTKDEYEKCENSKRLGIKLSCCENKRNNKMVIIKSKQCVNSKWIAAFLANEQQEYCQCGTCKIRVVYRGYEYIVTEQELKRLEDKSRQVDTLMPY